MNGDRVGRAVRALRHARDWTQTEHARRAGCSASVISRLERGNLRACSLGTLDGILGALRARLVMSVDWRGGELSRLLDADHAQLQERWAAVKQAARRRWEAHQEVTYNHYGDRGSIEDLSFDPRSGTLLVSELKSGIFDVQRMLAKIDEKERLAAGLADRFGWEVRRIVSCLVVADTRTNRRRVVEHAAIFSRFDCRGRSATAWLSDQAKPATGLLLFVPLANGRAMQGRRAGRQRVRGPAASATSDVA